jgi:hypothetical protein
MKFRLERVKLNYENNNLQNNEYNKNLVDDFIGRNKDNNLVNLISFITYYRINKLSTFTSIKIIGKNIKLYIYFPEHNVINKLINVSIKSCVICGTINDKNINIKLKLLGNTYLTILDYLFYRTKDVVNFNESETIKIINMIDGEYKILKLYKDDKINNNAFIDNILKFYIDNDTLKTINICELYKEKMYFKCIFTKKQKRHSKKVKKDIKKYIKNNNINKEKIYDINKKLTKKYQYTYYKKNVISEQSKIIFSNNSNNNTCNTYEWNANSTNKNIGIWLNDIDFNYNNRKNRSFKFKLYNDSIHSKYITSHSVINFDIEEKELKEYYDKNNFKKQFTYNVNNIKTYHSEISNNNYKNPQIELFFRVINN